MDTLVVTSMRQSAGKTSVIIGIAKALNRKIGYIKPFGERFLYRKKRLWDYDAALITNIFGLEENPEDMSIGFHHAKLLYMLDEVATGEKLRELSDNAGGGKELFFVECGKDITYGASVHLDAISIARQMGAPLVVVASGDENTLLDDLIFLMKHVQLGGLDLKGVIINKVSNIADFCDTRLPKIKQNGVEVLGLIPFYKELSYFSVSYLADRLFAKIITCEEHLDRPAMSVFIGSMPVGTALKNPLFRQGNMVVVTHGDRHDMIGAALENNATAVILTNNTLPPSNLIAEAAQRGIPLLLVTADMFETSHQIDCLESLPTKDDSGKIALIEQMVRTHVNLGAILPSSEAV
ncbi:MAG: DRTGG domain-containing protein [Syntrophales bacterium]